MTQGFHSDTFIDTMDASDVGKYGTLRVLKRLEDEIVACYPIDDEEVTIGRDPSCNLRLYYDSVSSVHCKLIFENRKVRRYQFCSLSKTLPVNMTGFPYGPRYQRPPCGWMCCIPRLNSELGSSDCTTPEQLCYRNPQEAVPVLLSA